MRTVIVIFICCFCFLQFLDAGLTIQDLTTSMNAEELAQSGLNKLTDHEKQFLQLWLQYRCPNYYISVPRKKNAGDVKSYFKTEKSTQYPNTANHWKLALVAVFQDETPFLKEFIEFHQLMGVEHFFLYDNLSSEHFYDVLQKYIDSGIVEVIEWPVTNFVYGQNSCYTDAVNRCRGKADWLILADTDLFFFPLNHPNLVSFLSEYDHPLIGGVTANILNFGTSGLYDLPPGGLLTELFVMRAKEPDAHVRCIVRPERVQSVKNPHFASYIPPYFAVDENLTRNEGLTNDRKSINKIRINHYAFRTQKFLLTVYGLRHVRFQAEHRGEPLPIELSSDNTQALLKMDADYCKVKDREIGKFLNLLKKLTEMK